MVGTAQGRLLPTYFLATTETIFGVLIFLGYWSPRLGILGALLFRGQPLLRAFQDV